MVVLLERLGHYYKDDTRNSVQMVREENKLEFSPPRREFLSIVTAFILLLSSLNYSKLVNTNSIIS